MGSPPTHSQHYLYLNETHENFCRNGKISIGGAAAAETMVQNYVSDMQFRTELNNGGNINNIRGGKPILPSHPKNTVLWPPPKLSTGARKRGTLVTQNST